MCPGSSTPAAVPIDHEAPASCFECGVDTFEIGEFSYRSCS